MQIDTFEQQILVENKKEQAQVPEEKSKK